MCWWTDVVILPDSICSKAASDPPAHVSSLKPGKEPNVGRRREIGEVDFSVGDRNGSFYGFSPSQECEQQNSPELRPVRVLVLCHIQRGTRYDSEFTPGSSAHLTSIRKVQKITCILKLDTSPGKKQTIYILKHSFVETVILAPLTTTLATLDMIQPKNPTKDIEKHFPPAWRIAVWPVKEHKTLSLEKPYPTHLNGANVYLPIHEWLLSWG